MKPSRPTGRPPGKDYPIARTMLLTEADLAALGGLAEAWGCSMTEVVRRLIRAEAKRQGRSARRAQPAAEEQGHKGGWAGSVPALV